MPLPKESRLIWYSERQAASSDFFLNTLTRPSGSSYALAFPEEWWVVIGRRKKDNASLAGFFEAFGVTKIKVKGALQLDVNWTTPGVALGLESLFFPYGLLNCDPSSKVSQLYPVQCQQWCEQQVNFPRVCVSFCDWYVSFSRESDRKIWSSFCDQPEQL